MQNNLGKAAWLMGTHLETAYANGTQGIDNYTLFHNPTDGKRRDFLECGFDKQNLLANSSCSQHLAAVLKEAQERGHRTRWVAHSQGASIFVAAVEFALKHYGMRLDCPTASACMVLVPTWRWPGGSARVPASRSRTCSTTPST